MSLLLGGPMHGEEVAIPDSFGGRFVVETLADPLLTLWFWSNPDLPVSPKPVRRWQTDYRREKIALPICRDGWEPVEEPEWRFADLHPLLWPEWSTRIIWLAPDYRHRVDRAMDRVNGAVYSAALMADAIPLAEYRGADAWAFYRLQKKHPDDRYISEFAILMVDRALDELDKVLAGEGWE